MTCKERFLKYIAVSTASDEDSTESPSTTTVFLLLARGAPDWAGFRTVLRVAGKGMQEPEGALESEGAEPEGVSALGRTGADASFPVQTASAIS